MTECDLRPGDWIARDEQIATVVGDGPWRVVGYVGEREAHLLAPGARARFFPDGCPERSVDIIVQTMERDAALGLHVRRGRVVISAGAEATIVRWTRRLAALLWREAGF